MVCVLLCFLVCFVLFTLSLCNSALFIRDGILLCDVHIAMVTKVPGTILEHCVCLFCLEA